MRFKITQIHIDFLTKKFITLSLPELTIAFNEHFGLDKTKVQIKSTISNYKILCGRKTGRQKGVSQLFTHSQVEFIKAKYLLHKPKRVAELLNKTCNGSFTEAQIKSFVHNHGINCGRSGHFEKGIVPWNTGTKGVMKVNKTSFKKGDIPLNHRPVGSERITKDGYRSIKIAEPNKWELLQRYNWALIHGNENMPENLRFKDGNRLNCEPDNLEPVTNSEHMRLTHLGYNTMPDEVKPVILNIVKMEDKIYKLTNNAVA
jgi:hypothetical protein